MTVQVVPIGLKPIQQTDRITSLDIMQSFPLFPLARPMLHITGEEFLLQWDMLG
jgi:hypothetical protein